MDYETGKKWIWKNTVWASLYTVFFGLSVASTVPWLWLMSIDAHWYSTMYSWYTFASTFVSGMSLVALFVIFLKNRGQLEYVTEEHLHDVAKFMFAFSVFWTYLWFSQYMLIWYSNQPEETKYFIERIGTAGNPGPYKGLFFLNLILNFLCPLLILMKRGIKRNWTMVTVIISGKIIDIYVDGKLTRSCATPSYFKVDPTKDVNIKICERGGFDGYIGNTSVANYSMNPDEIYRTYLSGPSGVSLDLFSWLASILKGAKVL
jgi:hypothetical protein